MCVPCLLRACRPLSQPQGRDIDVKSGRNEEDREEGEANGSQSDGSSLQ